MPNNCVTTANQLTAVVSVRDIQDAPIKKNNPLGKIHYLSYCNRFYFFHQIYRFHRTGFTLYMQQISLQYLLWFKNYNHL